MPSNRRLAACLAHLRARHGAPFYEIYLSHHEYGQCAPGPPMISEFGSDPGTYALVLQSRTSRATTVGQWGVLDLRRGYYVYVGSALGRGGLLARVSRHCRGSRRKHWHIDYLRECASPWAVWYRCSTARLEHEWAAALAEMPGTTSITGFGCSDCRCDTHLFYTARAPRIDAFSNAVKASVYSVPCSRVLS